MERNWNWSLDAEWRGSFSTSLSLLAKYARQGWKSTMLNPAGPAAEHVICSILLHVSKRPPRNHHRFTIA
jgi:hypothetical protein